MKPQLPTRPREDPDRISAAWLRRLLDCVAWAMAHPVGDGRTILRDSGVLHAVQAPVQATAAATGGSDIAWVGLSGLHADSPAAGERVYAGSLYAAPDAAAGDAVTIRIPSVADDWTAPASGVWADLPLFSAVPLASTWTGATETHTDTVYWLLDPFRWY